MPSGCSRCTRKGPSTRPAAALSDTAEQPQRLLDLRTAARLRLGEVARLDGAGVVLALLARLVCGLVVRNGGLRARHLHLLDEGGHDRLQGAGARERHRVGHSTSSKPDRLSSSGSMSRNALSEGPRY